MSSVGGYFGLEFKYTGEYHSKAISLNSARNALEYILKTRQYSKIYIPYFTCDVILEPLKKLNIKFEFYTINENLEPKFDYTVISINEAFLYTNYFGLKDVFIKCLSLKVQNLIIDNSQSFYSKPNDNIDTFYSPRKFFGVSDGGYLYCSKVLNESFEQDKSYERMLHLMMRADEMVEDGYPFFSINEKNICNQPIKRMSIITKKILGSIDYGFISNKRRENFIFLHEALKHKNLFQFDYDSRQIPLSYPLWIEDTSIKQRLLDNRVYCSTYWPNVLKWSESNSVESKITNEIIHLPIDQRYDLNDMRILIDLIF